MALFKTSLQLDAQVTREFKKIAFAGNTSFNRLVRELMAEHVRKHKRATRARLKRAAHKAPRKSRP
jgi:predicted DNA-binding ribbon-helix-helix protein